MQQRIQLILRTDCLADGAKHAQQLALGLPALAQQDRQLSGLPMKVGPIGVLPDPVRMIHGACLGA